MPVGYVERDPETGYDCQSDLEQQLDEDAATRSWDAGCQQLRELIDEHGMSKVLRMLAHARDQSVEAFVMNGPKEK